MNVASFVILLACYASGSNGLDYTYNHQAGGWFKLHNPASWSDASIICDSEGAVLVSPETSQIRDAVKSYMTRVGNQHPAILTGIQADFSSGDYYTINRVSLTKLPVTVDVGSTDDGSSESCVKWFTNKAIVKVVSCDIEHPFVCFKKRKTVQVVGCGNTDYIYDQRSGSCYKFHPVGLKWSKAYHSCKSEGAYLAINNNMLENKVLMDIFAKYPTSALSSYAHVRAFMGIRDWLNGESWKTVKGQTLADAGFVGWSQYEPNNVGGKEHCVSMYRDGTYNDDDCNLSLVYICEKDPELLYS